MTGEQLATFPTRPVLDTFCCNRFFKGGKKKKAQLNAMRNVFRTKILLQEEGKSVHRSDLVEYINTHKMVSSIVNDTTVRLIDPEEAFIAHYRYCDTVIHLTCSTLLLQARLLDHPRVLRPRQPSLLGRGAAGHGHRRVEVERPRGRGN
jgi:hypothetical protein